MAATDLAPAQLAAASPPQEITPPAPESLGSLALLLRFATTVTLMLAVAAFPRSAFFPVREVVVEGAQAVPPAEVIARSGVRKGDRLFLVPAGQVAARVAGDPHIAIARVSIVPPGRVAIRIVERVPYAAVPYRGGFLVLDDDGVVIESRPNPAGLPVIVFDGSALSWMRFGDRLPSDEARVGLDALQRLPSEVAVAGTRLRVGDGGGLTMVTPDGIPVLLGQMSGLRERAGVLPQLLTSLRQKRMGVQYLDLRIPGSVVLKPSGAPGGGGVRP